MFSQAPNDMRSVALEDVLMYVKKSNEAIVEAIVGCKFNVAALL